MKNDINKFIDYVLTYYKKFPLNKDTPYEVAPFTRDEIEVAISIRFLFSPDFDGDSFDREKVRDIILQIRQNWKKLDNRP